MSQTAINRPFYLKDKNIHAKLALDTVSATNSTKDSPGMKSDFTVSPYENPLTISTEEPEEVFFY